MPWIHEVDEEVGSTFTQHVMTVATAKALNPEPTDDAWWTYPDDAVAIVCADENGNVIWVSTDHGDIDVDGRVNPDVPVNDWRKTA